MYIGKIASSLIMILTLLLTARAHGSDHDLGAGGYGALQGEWQLVYGVHDGIVLPQRLVEKTQIIVSGNTFVFPHDASIGTSARGTFTVDTSAIPFTIDSYQEVGPYAGKTFLGIYELHGADAYTIALAPPGKPRPTSFASPLGSGILLQVWQRLE